MKPWKRQTTTITNQWDARLQWGHGDEAVEESTTVTLDQPLPGTLQWGHGDEAVEEFSKRHDLAAIVKASMGPRR